jgi:hypothetical protein
VGIEYDPPGPVSARFHQDDSFVRGLMGPVGSGKSSSCCIEIFYRALQQQPAPDGIRYSRWVAVRNTYGELKTTTLKTWQDWFRGLEVTKYDTPIVSTISMPSLGDGTGLHLEVLFIALDRPEDADKLRSLEITGGWMNEASELEKRVLDILTQRCGRYPSKKIGGPSWTGVIMDTNPPDDDSWWYKLAEEGTPEDYAFYKQPGGLVRVTDRKSPNFGKLVANPLAENIANLQGGHTYYQRQLAGKGDDYIRVFLEGQYGTTVDGKPVYPEWQDNFHIAKQPITPNPGRPLILAFDFGLTPACVFGQLMPTGTLAVLEELVSESMGIRQFYSEVVLPTINEKYGKFRIEAVGDPAGVNRSQTDEKTCFQELYELGLDCEPAMTNEFVKRRESVAMFLQRINGFLVDPGCKMLIKGFRGGYRYERVKASGSARYKDKPVKDKFSHPHDAMQYLALHVRGDMQTVHAAPVQAVAWA